MTRRHSAGLAALTAALVLGACGGPDPADVAADDPAFADCLAATGEDLEGSGDWSSGQAQDFWATPGTLECAVDTLDDEELTDVLAPAFPEIDFDDDTYLDELTAQQQVLADWATRTADELSLDETLPRAARVLASTPAGEDGYDFTEGLTDATALGAMRGAGELSSYETYLEEHPDDTDSAELMVRFSSGDNISEADRALLDQTRDAILDQVD